MSSSAISNRIFVILLCLLVLGIPGYARVDRIRPVWKGKENPSRFHSECQFCTQLAELEQDAALVLSRDFHRRHYNVPRGPGPDYKDSKLVRNLFDDSYSVLESTGGQWSYWQGYLGQEIFFVRFSPEFKDGSEAPKEVFWLCLAVDRLPSYYESGSGYLELRHSVGNVGLYQ